MYLHVPVQKAKIHQLCKLCQNMFFASLVGQRKSLFGNINFAYLLNRSLNQSFLCAQIDTTSSGLHVV
jgi:hypothetical protein